MKREGEIIFVTFRGAVWDREERLGGCAGTSQVSEDGHSDARWNLL